MAQISRPFQLALVAVVLVAFVSVLALHAHGSNPSEPAPTSAPTPTAVAKAAKNAARRRADRVSAAHKARAAAHSTAVHGTVVVRHGTATDPHKAARVQHETVGASSHKTATPPHRTAPASHRAVVHKAVVTPSVHAVTAPGSRSDSSAPKQHKRPAGQIAVEVELAQGKTVMLVFWNPHSAVDQEVHSQVGALVSGSKGTVVMHAALASQVNMFGSITEVVRVYQTPTILIVNRHGVVSTLTGLTEVFALQQAVHEAQRASH
jgi:hypothetical protein